MKVVETGAFVRISKQLDNPFHADIYYGIILQKGEPAPAELSLVLKTLTKLARFYPDTNPSSTVWEGGDVTDC